MNRIPVLGLALVLLIATTSTTSEASAEPESRIVFSEIQTGTAASASQEFVELYNPSTMDVQVAGWAIEYKSATSPDTSWTKKITLSGSIKSHGFYLIAPKSYLATADSDWSATLAGAAGNLRLKSNGGLVVDQLGYGETANASEGHPAPAPPAGESIERLPGRLNELGGNGTDTNDNVADFVLRLVPLPQSTTALIETPGLMVSTEDVPLVEPDPPLNPISYAPIYLTELLVNPVSPAVDAADEYIELYNPTGAPVNLQGYTLRAGSNFHSYFVIPAMNIAPLGYAVFYSKQTGIALSNSGGAAELMDPAGTVIDTTPVYGAAPEGQAWARFDEGWRWSLQLTPGLANVLAAPVVALTTKSGATTQPKSSKTTSRPATQPKKASVSKPDITKPTTKKTTLAKAPSAAIQSFQPAIWLIICLAVLTMGYACYEFRYDIQRYYYRLTGNTKASQQGRKPAERRGVD